MARTAPVPNFAAIPGMNPGLFVLGGGGDGGGSGSGKGGAGKGKQGADGKNGGKDAKGGGKGAGSCGPGSGGGCPNPQHGNGGTAAGDPVDPVTGRVFTTPMADLALPGLIPLRITRSYSTTSIEQDVGLGPGWSHSLAWRIQEHRRTLKVFVPEATPVWAPRPEEGASSYLPCGSLTRHSWGYTLTIRQLTHVFDVRGEDGWLLSAIYDVYGNRIQLVYRECVLHEIVDSVGRTVRVRRHASGRIAAFEVKNAAEQGRWVAFVTYQHDDAGDLVATMDAEGAVHRFEYDAEHRLTSRREPGGLVATFRYDEAGRCVETWCRRAGDDGIDESVPGTLADGTRAKGFLHAKIEYGDGVTEVTTSRSIRRIEGNAFDKPDKSVFAGGVHTFGYDAAGNMTEYIRPDGATWKLARDRMGNVLSELDPCGGLTELEYDDRGLVIAMRNPAGGAARYVRDRAGRVGSITDDLGLVAAFEYDARGLLVSATLPNGGVTRMAYDDLANRTEVVEPDGARRVIRYDFLGRIAGFTDARGESTSFTYDRCGRLRSIRTSRGAVETHEHDGDGNLVRITDPDGRTTGLTWGGAGVVTEVRRPDGRVVRYRYDREQDLVRVLNEAGEPHVIERDVEGRIVAERTFDGREIRYLVDDLGRIVQVREGARTIDFAYDALGRLVERAYSDDRKDTFEYDPTGRLLSVTTGDVECAYTYDARGRCIREVTRRGTEDVVVERELDALGYPVKVSGPAGVVEVRRDVVGRPVEMRYGDEGSIAFRYDANGYRVESLLPLGGRIVEELDADSFPLRTSVLDSSAARSVGPGEPDWVGGTALGETFRRAWAWSPAGRRTAEIGLGGPAIDLLRDADGRVVERQRAGASLLRFGYGPTGDLFEPSAPRTYGPGGRLLAAGSTTLEYDEQGRVVTKRQLAGGEEKVWTYGWTDSDRLVEVRGPDGTRITFVYDAFARRVEKRVAPPSGPATVTRYQWQGDALAREIRETASASGDPVVEERCYLSVPGSVRVIAQRQRGPSGPGPLLHHVAAPEGTPMALVDGRGAVAWSKEATHFGALEAPAPTPFRLAGQIADEETGLHDNRFRYYDPETGCFLGPEPKGIGASLKPYAYADFYLPDMVDPDGLAQSTIFGPPDASGNRPVLATGQSGGNPSDLHPAVAAALPTSPNLVPNRTNDSRGQCAEPSALSNHLFNWEQNNQPNRCHPPDPNWQQNLGSALKQIDKNGGIKSGTANKTWPACENCSQMIPRLYTLAGMPPPGGVITPGSAGPVKNAPTFPAPASFLNNPANAGYSGFPNPVYNNGANPWPGGPSTLGTWQHNGAGWTQVQ